CSSELRSTPEHLGISTTPLDLTQTIDLCPACTERTVPSKTPRPACHLRHWHLSPNNPRTARKKMKSPVTSC
ncbi:hypothetical protein LEMLEM_LOCUS2549, partial [Lemmus lemmus]